MEQNEYSEVTANYNDRPLSRFLDDENLRIMEQFIPCCQPSVGRLIALQIKMMEIRKILYHFEGPQLKACGLEDDNRDMESVLLALKKGLSPERSGQIDQILQLLQFGKMFQRFSQITRDHPEILRLMNGSGDRQTGSRGPDAFSDPSLFLMLNSMINNGDGDHRDNMKNVLDLAMKGSGENIDSSQVNALLASLIGRQQS